MKNLIFITLCLITFNIYPQSLLLFDDDAKINTNAQSYFDRLTVELSKAQQTNISDFCDCLDDSLDSGARTKTLSQLGFDAFWLLSNSIQEAADSNLVKSGHNLSGVNAPTWTQWLGYTTASTGTKYLNTNFAPNQGVNYTKDNASIGAYISTSISAFNVTDIGCDDGTSFSFLAARFASNVFYGVTNSNAAGTTYANTSTTPGLFIGSRTSTTATALYGNGILLGNHTGQTSYNPLSYSMFIGSRNSSGSPNQTSNRNYRAAFVGKTFDATEIRKINNCLERYLDAIGAGVQ